MDDGITPRYDFTHEKPINRSTINFILNLKRYKYLELDTSFKVEKKTPYNQNQDPKKNLCVSHHNNNKIHQNRS